MQFERVPKTKAKEFSGYIHFEDNFYNFVDEYSIVGVRWGYPDGLSASFYLTDNDLVDEFEEEVRSKGLSDYYTVSTNEEEILAALEPVQNIVSFSVQFLVVILIIGSSVVACLFVNKYNPNAILQNRN